jgi:hypothetical protein
MLAREISVLIPEICPLKQKEQFPHIPAKFIANKFDIKYRYECVCVCIYILLCIIQCI